MQHRVYHRQIHSVYELKRRLIDVWCGLEQSIFNEAVDQWRGNGFWSILSFKQELSYRKQIVRQLRTQYVEGIYRPKYYTMTLKSRLRITQGHRKQNHWIDHTQLIISRVI